MRDWFFASMLRRTILRLLLLCLAFSIQLLRAQQPPVTAPAIKVEARVVLVDVVVTDQNGQAVPGLSKQDFHILEDGAPQSISSFDEHQGAAMVEVKLPPMPPNVFTNFPTTRSADSINILLLDLLNTQPQNQSFVRQQVIQFVEQVKPGTRLAVFALGSQLRMIRGFTNNVSGLAAALEDTSLGVNPEFSRNLPTPSQGISDDITIEEMRRSQASPAAIAALSQYQADQAGQQSASRTDLTLQAFQHIARYLSGIPARKNLIWFSDSFPITFFPDRSTKTPKNRGHVQKTSDMLTAAQIAIYPVSARALPGPFQLGDLGNTREEIFNELGSSQIAMETIAEETGGRAFYNTNALKDAISDAVNNGSHYYTLAYSPANNKADGKFRRIQVTVPESEYKLSYRRGYYADRPRAFAGEEGSQDPLMPLIGLGLPDFDQILFKLQIAAENPQPAPNTPRAGTNTALKPPFTRYQADFAVSLPDIAMSTERDGSRHGRIEIMLIAFDHEGKILNIVRKHSKLAMEPQVYEATRKVGLQIREELDVPPSEVYLRAGIYDLTSGNCGTIGVPIHNAAAQVSAK
jgi:VWFA-related protein